MAYASTEKARAAARAYYHKNKDKVREKQRAWARANPEKKRAIHSRFRERNKERLLEENRKFRDENPSRARDWDLKKFGITSADFDRMLAEQNGMCAIPGCGGTKGIHGGNLCVDHDHKTGKIRGLLCGHCNLVLGHAKDNPDLLEFIAKWLRGKL